MKRSQSRSQQPKPLRSIKKDALKKVIVTKKTQAVDIAIVMVGPSSTVESTSEKMTPVVHQVTPAMVSDVSLREFLVAADIHAQQTFLAQVAMIAAKDAKEQVQKVQDQLLKLAQIKLADSLQQYQQLEAKFQASQQEITKLKRRRA